MYTVGTCIDQLTDHDMKLLRDLQGSACGVLSTNRHKSHTIRLGPAWNASRIANGYPLNPSVAAVEGGTEAETRVRRGVEVQRLAFDNWAAPHH